MLLADIEDFFRRKGCIGINIDDRSDVLLLLYADDLIIFANGPSDLRRKMQLLSEYCGTVGLTINPKKTTAIRFNGSGNIRKLRSKTLTLYNIDSGLSDEIGVVNSCVYLGVTFPVPRWVLKQEKQL